MTEKMKKTTAAFKRLGLEWQSKLTESTELYEVVKTIVEKVPGTFQEEQKERFEEFVLLHIGSRMGRYAIVNKEKFAKTMKMEAEFDRLPEEISPYLVIQHSEDRKTSLVLHPTEEKTFFENIALAIQQTPLKENVSEETMVEADVTETVELIVYINDLFTEQQKTAMQMKIIEKTAKVLLDEFHILREKELLGSLG